MSTTEIKALLDLLLDDDSRIRSAAADRLCALGAAGAEALEVAASSDDARLRARARGILWTIHTSEACRRFEALLADDVFDLEAASIMLARTEVPDLSPLVIEAELDRLAEGLKEQIEPEAPNHETAEVFGRFLCETEGFRGNSVDPEDPRNTYLDQVLRRRIGIPISLSAVYLMVGRRLGLELRGVGMPFHFLVSMGRGEERVLLDPFGGGRIMSPKACKALLAGYRLSFREEYLRPISDRHMMRRIIANLVRAWHGRGDACRLTRLYGFVNVLQKK